MGKLKEQKNWVKESWHVAVKIDPGEPRATRLLSMINVKNGEI